MSPFDDGGGGVVACSGQCAHAQSGQRRQGRQAVATAARVSGVVDGVQVAHRVGGKFVYRGEWLGGWVGGIEK